MTEGRDDANHGSCAGGPARPLRRILLLDDEEAILTPLARYFRARGCQVMAAREPEEAEALFEHHPFDLVVLDLSLTRFGYEGLAVLAAIRARNPWVPVIVLSAHASTEVEEEALRRGADAVLRKPQPLGRLAGLAFGLMGLLS